MGSQSHITPASRLSLSASAVSTSIPGGTVVLDPASGHYFGLEGVGVRVWQLLAQPVTLVRLVETITDEFEVDAATCERDLRALLDDLLGRGLVTIADAEA